MVLCTYGESIFVTIFKRKSGTYRSPTFRYSPKFLHTAKRQTKWSSASTEIVVTDAKRASGALSLATFRHSSRFTFGQGEKAVKSSGTGIPAASAVEIRYSIPFADWMAVFGGVYGSTGAVDQIFNTSLLFRSFLFPPRSLWFYRSGSSNFRHFAFVSFFPIPFEESMVLPER